MLPWFNNMSESFAELFEESFASQQIKPGSIITGIVVAVNDDVVIVSAGLKSEAVIPIEQFKNDKRLLYGRKGGEGARRNYLGISLSNGPQ